MPYLIARLQITSVLESNKHADANEVTNLNADDIGKSPQHANAAFSNGQEYGLKDYDNQN
jgi:hypothetical protein